MLYQSDYWVATGVLEQKETIINFLETDAGITSLVILDHRNDTTSTIKEIIESVYEEATECNLRFCIGSQTHTYDSNTHGANETHTKTIHVRGGIDEATIALMKSLYPILAIFV
jgi:hypothetical protein